MALVRRHDCLLLRVGTGVLLVALMLGTRTLRAQSGETGVAAGVTPLPAAARPAPAPQQRVLDIRITGNRSISREKVLANIGTKIDRPFDQATFDSDVRKLVGKHRNGATPDLKLHWRREFMRFENAEVRRHDEFEQFNTAESF